MANKRISELASASALSGAEVLPIVQVGATKKVTTQAIADLAGGGIPSVTIVADGSIGGPLTIGCNTTLFIPEDTNGTVQAEIKILPNIGISGGGGYGGGPVTATTISFPDLELAGDFQIQGVNSLVSLSANALVRSTNQVSVYNNSSLQSLSLANLETTTYLTLGNTPNLTSLSFPKLKSVTNGLSINGPISSTITGYTSAIFPVLETANIGWGYSYLSSFNVDLPNLKKLTGLSGTNSVASLTINLPNLIEVTNASLYISYISGLTNLILGTPGVTKKWGVGNNPNISANNCALNQASVDNLLSVLASLDGTNGTTAANNGSLYLTYGSNASPSSTGLAAKAVLLNRGWYIQHN